MTPPRRTISATSLPSRLPVTTAALAYLLMERFGAPGWVIGAVLTLFALVCVGVLVERRNETREDVPGFGNATRPRRSFQSHQD
jgi:hypothetical protein